MANPEGESENGPLRLVFGRRLKLEYHGSRLTSDAGLLAYRELDNVFGLTGMVRDERVDARMGKNGQQYWARCWIQNNNSYRGDDYRRNLRDGLL